MRHQLDGTSWVNREVHAQICGGRRGKFPPPTRQLAEGNPGFDFLGFHHRLVRGRTPKSAHLTFLARWPSRKAAQHARDRIREITGRERLLVPAEVIVTELNRFLRGSPGAASLLHDVA